MDISDIRPYSTPTANVLEGHAVRTSNDFAVDVILGIVLGMSTFGVCVLVIFSFYGA